jgi:acyl CoA:acetate/3-ketoacid CoA transferase alpha subunit
MITKPEAIVDAIRQSEVGDTIIIHNSDGSVWCVIKIETKEHPEH